MIVELEDFARATSSFQLPGVGLFELLMASTERKYIFFFVMYTYIFI